MKKSNFQSAGAAFSLLLLLLFSGPAWAANVVCSGVPAVLPGPLQTEVNAASAAGPTTINVSGNCVENVNVNGKDGLTILGSSGATLTGVSAAAAALSVSNARNFRSWRATL